jgi:DNA-binding CsgD family transcriptional regulator
MKDERKTKEQLIYELVELRQRLAGLEKSKAEFERAEESLGKSSQMNQLLLDSLPHPAMLIRRDRIILSCNRIARVAGAEVGNYCWRSFGQSEYIPEEDKLYINDNAGNVPPGGTKCTFCLADEAFNANHPTNNPEVESFGQLWDTWWVPVEDNIYLHYAINTTERKRAEDLLKWKHLVDEALTELYKPLISKATSIEEMTIAILNHARKLTGSIHGYVSEVDLSTGDNICHTLTEMMRGDQCKVSPADQRIIFPRGDDGLYGGLWGYSLNTLEPFFINSAETHPASTGLPEGHVSIKRFLSVPVVIDGELVGQIGLANKEDDYTEQDLEAICRIAEFYALAVQRRRVGEALFQRKVELEEQSNRLEEANIALKVLLKRIEKDKADLDENVLANVKGLVLPYVEELKGSKLDPDQKNLVGILELNIREIVSPFAARLSSTFSTLTPSEIKIASMIKDGKNTKDIAASFCLSEHTIKSHRSSIRRKLKLKNKQINLESYLRSLQE